MMVAAGNARSIRALVYPCSSEGRVQKAVDHLVYSGCKKEDATSFFLLVTDLYLVLVADRTTARGGERRPWTLQGRLSSPLSPPSARGLAE